MKSRGPVMSPSDLTLESTDRLFTSVQEPGLVSAKPRRLPVLITVAREIS